MKKNQLIPTNNIAIILENNKINFCIANNQSTSLLVVSKLKIVKSENVQHLYFGFYSWDSKSYIIHYKNSNNLIRDPQLLHFAYTSPITIYGKIFYRIKDLLKMEHIANKIYAKKIRENNRIKQRKKRNNYLIENATTFCDDIENLVK